VHRRVLLLSAILMHGQLLLSDQHMLSMQHSLKHFLRLFRFVIAQYFVAILPRSVDTQLHASLVNFGRSASRLAQTCLLLCLTSCRAHV